MKKSVDSKRRFSIGIALLFAILMVSGSCSKATDSMSPQGSGTGGKSGSDGPGINEVWIEGMTYNPSTITVTAGTTIKWTNKDIASHTVTSDAGLFDSKSFATNGTFSLTFSTAGTFKYYCTLHPSMVANVVVN